MKKILVFLMIFSFLAAAVSLAKYADLAGSWYSDNEESLRRELSGYFQQANVPEIKGDIIGVISPHAGFRFSGSVAAYSYKALMQKNPKLVILIAFSHRKYYPGKVAALDDRFFKTPLGEALIDTALTDKLINGNNNIVKIPGVFSSENSIETQIPFIQMAAENAKLVVLAICDQRQQTCDELARELYNVLRDRDDYAIVASSDMCHYLTYDHANIKDSNTINVIKQFDADAFYGASMKEKRPDNLMCGYGAAYTLIKAAKMLGADKVDILKYANSGDTFGSKDRVVGYLSAVFYESVSGSLTPVIKNEEEKGMFNKEQRKELLKIARSTIEHYLATGKKLDVTVEDPLLEEDMGAFVTLHRKGQLRGCIGHMVATGPLYLTVRDMAIAASVQDPRFPPVKKNELDDIDIEVSVLTPMKKIDDYNEIKIPGNGVMVRKGFRSGVYLPQVAEETGWDREEFMNSLCAHKAGIPRNSWKTGECDLYTFTAEVFGEKDTQ